MKEIMRRQRRVKIHLRYIKRMTEWTDYGSYGMKLKLLSTEPCATYVEGGSVPCTKLTSKWDKRPMHKGPSINHVDSFSPLFDPPPIVDSIPCIITFSSEKVLDLCKMGPPPPFFFVKCPRFETP